MKKHAETIIVGGGVAGLACAAKLHQEGKDFILITKDLGGRLCTSTNGKVNYGAYILPSTDKHIRKIARPTKRIRLFHLDFHNKKERYSFWEACIFWKELLHFYPYILWMRSYYKRFRKYAKKHGQASAFKTFPKLYDLYKTPAETFVRQKGISNITERFLIEPIWMCTFAHLKHLNAFDFMHIVMHLGVPVYKFESQLHEFVTPFKKKILHAEVASIEESDLVRIALKNGDIYTANHLVLATPPHITATHIPVSWKRRACKAHLFHIKGELKQEFSQGDLELFNDQSNICFLAKENDGTCILYTNKKSPNLSRFFTRHHIIESRSWDPAFSLGGSKIIDQDFSSAITLAGDFNIVGLEDSYISGLYAARRAIQLSQKL